MTYTQFRNTLQDLRQCRNTLREARSLEELTEEMSQDEVEALQDMPKVLAEMLRYFDNLWQLIHHNHPGRRARVVCLSRLSSPTAETTDLKSVKCGFESHLSYPQFFSPGFFLSRSDSRLESTTTGWPQLNRNLFYSLDWVKVVGTLNDFQAQFRYCFSF